MGNKLFHQDRQSIQQTIKQIDSSIHSQHNAINSDGVYMIEFVDTDYLDNKGGFTTIRLIVISFIGKIQALLSFWEILKDDIPLIHLNFTNDKTTIYDIDQYNNIIMYNMDRCCTDNIDSNLNNFTNNLKMSPYDKITIKQLHTDNSTDC